MVGEVTHDIPEPTITLTLQDARHLFDLAIDTPLLCSGSFETDDVKLLRSLAEKINVDPSVATPDDFVRDFPHVFKAWIPSVDRKPNSVNYETDAEAIARLGGLPVDRCSAGRFDRYCRRPQSDPMHIEAK